MQPIGNFDRSTILAAAWPLSRVIATRKRPVVQSTVSSEGVWVIVSRSPVWGRRIAVVWVVPRSAPAFVGNPSCQNGTVVDMALLGN
jgi:hypothetical protein